MDSSKSHIFKVSKNIPNIPPYIIILGAALFFLSNFTIILDQNIKIIVYLLIFLSLILYYFLRLKVRMIISDDGFIFLNANSIFIRDFTNVSSLEISKIEVVKRKLKFSTEKNLIHIFIFMDMN